MLSGCNSESADWKSASTADNVEAYQQFLQQHPHSANADAANARVKALLEDRDWQAASAADTRSAYEQFVTQHVDSKWVQEARIRIENFAQGGSGGTASAVAATAAPVPPLKKAAKATTASAATAAHGNFVQLGAFKSKQRAQSEWKQLSAKFPSELKTLKPAYVEGSSKAGPVFRLRVPVSSLSAAKGLCDSLKKHSARCVAVAV